MQAFDLQSRASEGLKVCGAELLPAETYWKELQKRRGHVLRSARVCQSRSESIGDLAPLPSQQSMHC